jgi:hypothetical protein
MPREIAYFTNKIYAKTMQGAIKDLDKNRSCWLHNFHFVIEMYCHIEDAMNDVRNIK